jgi:uncharacterized protein YheU (UPF0270 family)
MLTAYALRRVLDECVTRDRTGLSDVNAKVAEVRRKLEDGRAELHFDDEDGTTTIVPVRR